MMNRLKKIFFVLCSFGLMAAVATITAKPTLAAETCQSQSPLIQFRRSYNGNWTSSNSITPNLKVGENIDVNCFAKNGSALFTDGYITMTNPFGQTSQVSNTSELRNYAVLSPGNYSFSCQSRSIASCSSNDTITVAVQSSPSPVPSPTPTPSPIIPQRSSCDNLMVVSGNNSLVPATIRLRATGSDNYGNIQKYRFFFGDGEQMESDNPEVEHRYTVSGSFTARVDVKDSRGNYQTSSACQTTVTVQAASVESHKSACSTIYVTADHGAVTPSNVSVQVTGFDNKGGLQGYRVDFGNGIVSDSSNQTITYRYDHAGSYVVRGYVKDHDGNWIGGDQDCQKTISITVPTQIITQPKTGVPTVLPIMGGMSAVAGIVVEMLKRQHR